MVLWTPGAGFTSLGRKGLPAEEVAETAVAEFRRFVDNKAAVDRYLADQLLLPLALARGGSQFTTDKLTTHTQTNAALLRQWLGVSIDIDGDIDQPATIAISGLSFWRGT
jgi:RNA 3'-terminal phosphate cyclase (ATP)